MVFISDRALQSFESLLAGLRYAFLRDRRDLVFFSIPVASAWTDSSMTRPCLLNLKLVTKNAASTIYKCVRGKWVTR